LCQTDGDFLWIKNNIASLYRMKTLLIFISFVFSLSFSFGQEEKVFVLYGKVYDAEYKEPIPYVKVAFNGQDTYTNTAGEFSLKVKYIKEGWVEFSHVGFKQRKEILTDKMVKRKVVSDTLVWSYMRLEGISLGPLMVSAFKVDTVFGSQFYSVEDYAFLPEENMLLLAYEKTLDKQAKLLLIDSEQALVDTYTIPERALHLYTDYAANNYVVCEVKIYRINIRGDEIHLLSISDEDFYGFHHRVIDTIGDRYYYSNYNELYPAVKFYVTERNDTTHIELYEVKDDFMMELYRAQYKYVSGRDKLWAYRKEQATGIDKEIWIGANSFTRDILYKPVYAPLFIINDTVLVFDQYKNKILKFDEYNDSAGVYFMNYHQAPKGEKWEQPIIEDKLEELIYAIYNGGGYTYVRQIKYRTGLIGKTTKLKFRFIENIKIEKGYVYYIYRPFESSQKRFLYKEKLAKG
jgi:hypothetical protein